MLSMTHMIVVFIIVLVVFGPQKLPELARGLGKLMAEFRKASFDFKSAFEQEMRDLERQALMADRKKAVESAALPVSTPDQPAALAAPLDGQASMGDSATIAHAGEPPTIAPVTESVPRLEEPPGEASNDGSTAATGVASEHSSHDERQPT